jgi:flagellar basal-body rod protein FlgG
MSRSLFTAATGMQAQQLKIDVVANNLANVNTDGFKRSRAEFQDLMYQALRSAGTSSSVDTQVPTGLEIGLGARPVATARNFEQGDLKNTGNSLDVAIEGAGFLQVTMPSGEIAYTRNGALKIDAEGLLVTSDGYPLEPRIVVPRDAVAVTIGADGTVGARLADRSEPVQLGQLTLANVVDLGGLEGPSRRASSRART